jgi:hypothetical protein
MQDTGGFRQTREDLPGFRTTCKLLYQRTKPGRSKIRQTPVRCKTTDHLSPADAAT